MNDARVAVGEHQVAVAQEPATTEAETPYDVSAVYRRVLIPIDFSECSARALLTGADMQRRFGSEIVLFTATGFDDNDRFLAGTGAPWSVDDVVGEGRRHLENYRREIAPGIQATYDARIADDVAGAIEAAAVRWDATLVVLGLHARKIHRFFRSDAEKVARALPCSVMLLKTDLPNPKTIRVRD
jgi:nucleotide-binding universal stress UspA family protein